MAFFEGVEHVATAAAEGAGPGGRPGAAYPAPALKGAAGASARRGGGYRAAAGLPPFRGSTPAQVGDKAAFSFAVRNTGAAHAAVVKLQISPDGEHWVDESPERTLLPGEMAFLTAGRVCRYARVAYRALAAGYPTTPAIWFQARA